MKARPKPAPAPRPGAIELARKARARRLARRPGAEWRFQTGGSLELKALGGTSVSERFDEVVVDDWLHAEMLATRSCFVTVAGIALWLHLKPSGAVLTHAEARDADPESVETLLRELGRRAR